jgi:HK97 family phage portal protein
VSRTIEIAGSGRVKIATKPRKPKAEKKSWPLAGIESRFRRTDFRTSIDLVLNNPATYAELYRSQPWIYIAVNKIARSIAQLPLKCYSIDFETGNRQRLREPDPLVMVTRQPSRFMGRQAFVLEVCSSLAIYGNALVLKDRSRKGGPPTELWPVDWSKVRIVAGDRQPIEAYEYHGANGIRTWLPEDVIHFKWFGTDGLRGISPLEPLARTLALEDAAQRYATASFRNAARPNVAFVTEGELEDDTLIDLRQQLQNNTGPDGSFQALLLQGGVKLEQFSHTAQEAEVIAHRKLNREEVAAAYQVDPTQIGILDRATFNNVEEAHRSFYMDTLGPWTTNIEEALMVQLVWPELQFANSFLEFDMTEVLKGNVKQRFDAYQSAVISGWMTRNEIRRLENLPPVDDRGADSLYAPLNETALDGRIPSDQRTPVGTPVLASSDNQ